LAGGSACPTFSRKVGQALSPANSALIPIFSQASRSGNWVRIPSRERKRPVILVLGVFLTSGWPHAVFNKER